MHNRLQQNRLNKYALIILISTSVLCCTNDNGAAKKNANTKNDIVQLIFSIRCYGVSNNAKSLSGISGSDLYYLLKHSNCCNLQYWDKGNRIMDRWGNDYILNISPQENLIKIRSLADPSSNEDTIEVIEKLLL